MEKNKMALTAEEEYLVSQIYNRIIREIQGSSFLGIPVDLNDDRMIAIAFYYHGHWKGGQEELTLIKD